MSRYFLFALIFSGGCVFSQELPIKIYLDSSFEAEDASVIKEAIATWNKQAGVRLKNPTEIFSYGGEGPAFGGAEDLNDGMHAIYKVDPNKLNGVIGWAPIERWGYATFGDVFIFIDAMRYRVADQNGKIVETRPRKPSDDNLVFILTLHELGHLLGLMHFNQVPAIMNTKLSDETDRLENLTEADLDAFCLIYECR